MVFIDTPGIHLAKSGGINEYMVNEARQALIAPSLVWYLVDPSSAVQFEKPVLDLMKAGGGPVIMLVNKIDLAGGKIPGDRFSLIASTVETALKEAGIPLLGVRHVSADKGTGVQDLLEASWEHLSEGPLYYPDEEQISDRPVRFFVAEMIREQLLHCLGEEIPYSCAVEIEKFDEQGKPPRIEAIIHVERDSQKGMVIGKGGAKIKEIGQKARQNIEAFVGNQVFLGLRIKVLKDWTRDADALRRLGYDLPKAKPAARKR